MTDKLYYPDVFTTINIPKTERRLAVKAKNLFDVAAGAEPWDPNVYAHLNKVTDDRNASQAFWEYDHEDGHTYDRFVMTMMQRGLTLAIEHRDFDVRGSEMRKSLIIWNGTSTVHTSGITRAELHQSRSEFAVASFKHDFYEMAARLGLHHHVSRQMGDQNESDAAIFANAA